ncbi:hypothetical protein HG536_0E05380 [Torulaspora globosa]|uniref:DnaJ homologue subfamily C member 28 conserved domain-containing protein n=1 Tax=Torulaspora globosa TaxID=48254 RepID=A0A7G3ZJE1_9SACH|nr:uncharacterized protein HG536_0E05380 [Torulaspora globosa]QLL33627.1 hypothetical protein HG536_0E05380 [Torulaspora globosa]
MNRLALLRYRYCPRRFQSTKDDGGYLAARLQELKEQNDPNPDDPLVKLTQGKSLVDEDAELQKIYQKLDQKAFEERYRREIQYAKIPNHVNQQSKDTAVSEPWTGEEGVEFTSLRMILDSTGKPDGSSSSVAANVGFINAALPAKEPRAVRASKSFRRKLEDAQDRVLKFQRDQKQEIDETEQSEFRTLYAEKFTPIGSFEKLRSLADQRIEESMKQGGFDGLEHIKGKPSSFVQLNQHIDRTEHHLNNMLVRQNIAPPWIESQGRVNGDISAFRREAASMFENELLAYLDKTGILRHNATWESAKSEITSRFGSTGELLQARFSLWKTSQRSYFESRIKTLNSGLRTYNLQAPLSTQKLYLLPEKEFDRAYNSIDLEKLVIETLQERMKQTADSNADRSDGGFSLFRKSLKFW